MKPAIEEALKRVLTYEKLSKGDKSLLSVEVAEALELFSSIARFLPEAYHEDITPLYWPTMYPKVLQLFMQQGKEMDCKHGFVPLGPGVVARVIVSNHLEHPILGTSNERVKLLKAGFKGKEIEKLYLLFNDFKVVGIALHDCSGTASDSAHDYPPSEG